MVAPAPFVFPLILQSRLSPRNTRDITLSLLVLQTNTNFEPPTHPAQTERGLVVLPRRPTDREFFKLASSILRVRQHPRDSKTRPSHSCSTPDASRSRFIQRPIFGRHPPYQKDRPAICTSIYSYTLSRPETKAGRIFTRKPDCTRLLSSTPVYRGP